MKKNLRFNRFESKGRHEYVKYFENVTNFGDYEYVGYVKCKLVHNKYYSIVIPDQIYLSVGDELYWIQPLYFLGNFIGTFDDFGCCLLRIDISHNVRLKVEFKSDGVLSFLEDGSLFYHCKITGPKFLHRYVTGPAKIASGRPYIQLHHHTHKTAKMGIQSGGEFWSSNWNIQGTKETSNISYLYLTALPRISCDEDLCEIAMSSMGVLAFRVDTNFSNNPDLVLKVYRESTTKRTFTLSHWIDTSFLATQPVYRHTPISGPVYHEVVGPYIQRAGVEYGTTIKIKDKKLVPEIPKSFDYAVVGDATKVSGLAAPYDEEKTEEILKIEYMTAPEEIIRFWANHSNSDQYSKKNIELAGFKGGADSSEVGD